MQFIRPDTRYDFIGKRKFTVWISAIAILLGLGSIVAQGGLKYGVDFAGGLLVQVKFAKPIEIAGVRSGLEAMGFKDANVQKFGGEDEFLIGSHGGGKSSNYFSEHGPRFDDRQCSEPFRRAPSRPGCRQ